MRYHEDPHPQHLPSLGVVEWRVTVFDPDPSCDEARQLMTYMDARGLYLEDSCIVGDNVESWRFRASEARSRGLHGIGPVG